MFPFFVRISTFPSSPAVTVSTMETLPSSTDMVTLLPAVTFPLPRLPTSILPVPTVIVTFAPATISSPTEISPLPVVMATEPLSAVIVLPMVISPFSVFMDMSFRTVILSSSMMSPSPRVSALKLPFALTWSVTCRSPFSTIRFAS